MQFAYFFQVFGGLLLLLSLTPLSSGQILVHNKAIRGSSVARDLVERQGTDPSMTSSKQFKAAMLYGHYYFRRQHGVSVLAWNAQTAATAAAYAAKCKFAHSGTKGVGENIAAGFGTVKGVVNAWGGERTKYNFSKPGFSSATGHFTQVVWKGTTSVGCGRANCPGIGWFTVCQYTPQGNIVGGTYFAKNVLKQVSGKVTDVWNGQPT